MNDIIYIKIANKEDLKKAIEYLREQQNIIIECENYECMDYILPAVYALKGTMKKLSMNQYLVSIQDKIQIIEEKEVPEHNELLESLDKKIIELENINEIINNEMNSINDLLGSHNAEDFSNDIKKLESMRSDISRLLEEYLMYNQINDIEEELELDNLGLLDYLNLVDDYIVKTKATMNTYLNTTKNIYKAISIKNSTARHEEEE